MRARIIALGLLTAALGAAVPASAQVVHSIHLGAGLFLPRGLDSRTEGDVLRRNWLGESLGADPTLSDAMAFDISDFRGPQVFGEWTVGFGDHVEFGAGVGFYQRSVPTVYLDLIDENGREIEQKLRLRVVPISGVVRFLPFGRAGDVQPYVGAGVALLNYRYSEQGRFVDPDTLDLFEQAYTATGNAPAGIALAGIRLPMGGDIYGLSLEWRYVFGAGDTGGLDAGFLGDKIDLSGSHLNAAITVRF